LLLLLLKELFLGRLGLGEEEGSAAKSQLLGQELFMGRR